MRFLDLEILDFVAVRDGRSLRTFLFFKIPDLLFLVAFLALVCLLDLAPLDFLAFLIDFLRLVGFLPELDFVVLNAPMPKVALSS